MAFTWVRPADPSVLAGNRVLDLGCGDGQILQTLPGGVGLDRSPDALAAARHNGLSLLVCGRARDLPFADDAFEVVLAADLFHHMDPHGLKAAMAEVARVGHRLVAWWYELPGRPAPDAPRFPRSYGEVAGAARGSGLDPRPLELSVALEPAPATVGLVAERMP